MINIDGRLRMIPVDGINSLMDPRLERRDSNIAIIISNSTIQFITNRFHDFKDTGNVYPQWIYLSYSIGMKMLDLDTG